MLSYKINKLYLIAHPSLTLSKLDYAADKFFSASLNKPYFVAISPSFVSISLFNYGIISSFNKVIVSPKDSNIPLFVSFSN